MINVLITAQLQVSFQAALFQTRQQSVTSRTTPILSNVLLLDLLALNQHWGVLRTSFCKGIKFRYTHCTRIMVIDQDFSWIVPLLYISSPLLLIFCSSSICSPCDHSTRHKTYYHDFLFTLLQGHDSLFSSGDSPAWLLIYIIIKTREFFQQFRFPAFMLPHSIIYPHIIYIYIYFQLSPYLIMLFHFSYSSYSIIISI